MGYKRKKEAPLTTTTTTTTTEEEEISRKDEVSGLKKALLEKEQQIQKANLAMNNVNKFSSSLGLQKPFEPVNLNSAQEKLAHKKFSSINRHSVLVHELLPPMHKDVFKKLEEEKSVSKFVKTLMGNYLSKELRSSLSAHGTKINPSINTKIPKFSDTIEDLVVQKFGGVPKPLITKYINECCGEARNNNVDTTDSTNTAFVDLTIESKQPNNLSDNESEDSNSSASSRIASEISSGPSESESSESEAEREDEKVNPKKRKSKEKVKNYSKKRKMDEDN